jgi:hypothetical protein
MPEFFRRTNLARNRVYSGIMYILSVYIFAVGFELLRWEQLLYQLHGVQVLLWGGGPFITKNNKKVTSVHDHYLYCLHCLIYRLSRHIKSPASLLLKYIRIPTKSKNKLDHNCCVIFEKQKLTQFVKKYLFNTHKMPASHSLIKPYAQSKWNKHAVRGKKTYWNWVSIKQNLVQMI